MTSVFAAKTCGSGAWATTFAMFFSSADANTSAGAPSPIWVARVLDPSYTGLTVTPGFCCSNAAAISSNDRCSDAAA